MRFIKEYIISKLQGDIIDNNDYTLSVQLFSLGNDKFCKVDNPKINNVPLGTVISQFDLNGNAISTILLKGIQGYRNILVFSNGDYLVSGRAIDSNDQVTNDLVLIRTSTTGQVKWAKKIANNFFSTNYIGVVITSNDEIFVHNRINYTLSKFDSNGNNVGNVKITDDVYSDLSSPLFYSSSTDKLYILLRGEPLPPGNNPNNLHGGVVLAVFDTDLNQVGTKRYRISNNEFTNPAATNNFVQSLSLDLEGNNAIFKFRIVDNAIPGAYAALCHVTVPLDDTNPTSQGIKLDQYNGQYQNITIDGRFTNDGQKYYGNYQRAINNSSQYINYMYCYDVLNQQLKSWEVNGQPPRQDGLIVCAGQIFWAQSNTNNAIWSVEIDGVDQNLPDACFTLSNQTTVTLPSSGITVYLDTTPLPTNNPSLAVNDVIISSELLNIVTNAICPSVYDVSSSTISASSQKIDADGVSSTVITVQLKDTQNANIVSGGETVIIQTSAGSISPVIDKGNGKYEATLTSTLDIGNALLSFTVNDVASSNTTSVEFILKVNQEYFIKKYENTFTENLEFIGENQTSLFWTHGVVGSQGHMFLVTDRNFNPVLVKNFNESEVKSPATLQKVVPCSNGDVLILGNYLVSNNQVRGPFVIRLTEVGNVVWIKRYNTTIGLIGNSNDIDFHSLNNGLYVLNNPNPEVLFTIDEQGAVVNAFDTNNIPRLDSLVVHNQNIYGCTRDGSNPNTNLFGIAKFDFSLNLLEFNEYHFNTDLGANPTSREAFLIEDSLVISTTITSNGNENIYLAKVDLSEPLPTQVNAKFFTIDHILFQFEQSSNNFYIKYNEQGGSSREVILRLDQDLNFSSAMKIPSENVLGFYTVSDALYFTLSGYRMVKTSQSFYTNCFTLDNDATPVLQYVILTKDSTQTYAPSTLALQSFTFSLNVTDVSFSDFEELCTLFPRIYQSPHLYLQSAGSTGSDGSASGIHLRWLLKKDLINHIPKGNLASTTVNYNKPNDFVTLYRASYVPEITTIDFSQPPQAVENRNALWIYGTNGQTFYLYFRNKTKYASVRSSFDPLTQSIQFIQNYGSDLLEFRTSSDLFFAIQFTSSSTSSAAKVESEILSVEGSSEIQEKQITARRAFIGSELLNARLITENGKSLRIRPTNCHVTSISIELYSVFSNAIEDGPGWSEIGQFALSETDNEVFDRLEPTLNIVNGTWPRYNDGALVKIQNYKDKWNQPSPSTQSTIKQTVQDYVSLSDNEDNPLALETFSFDTTPPPGANPEDNTFEIPNLVLLQQAAMDYHVARMLGMGHLDISAGVQNSDSFVYMMKYDTLATLEDGQLIPASTEHRFMTPPTSRNNQKSPTSIDLKVPVPGVFLQGGIGEGPESLTDDNGYTFDGKSRYITLYAEEIEDLSRDLGFYNVTTEFNLALETTPVYAGIEYKKSGDPDWKRPELPSSPDYQNLAPSGQAPYNETVPLPIPDEGTALFVHRETESGEHIYSSYGVNWFSRITRSVQEHALTTTILPTNTLLPPSDRSALLIVEEQPLMLTTANEQVMRSNISGSDKTLIRLMFNYNSDVELQSYPISDPSINPLDPNTIFPDSEEVFADEIEIFFRNSMPSNVSGRATNVSDHPTNEILSVITTSSYTLESTEETITPTISLGSDNNFIGGILVLEEVEFIIHEVDTTNPDAPIFTVYKKQISDKLQNNNQPTTDEELEAPIIKTDGMFLAIENLQNIGSWGTPNPHQLKVKIGNNWPIHREVITRLNPDGNTEEFLQKTRGIWDNATIEKILQPVIPGGTPTIHKGQYKATFGSAILANHPQNGGANPVQWYKGIMRVHTISNPNGARRSLEVFKIENIGTSNGLIVYFTDKSFGSTNNEEIQTGGAIQVNFYPGYRIYLHANAAAGISENTVLPQLGEGVKYSCFGFRSVHNLNSYYSRIAIPTVMFAQEVIVPLVPQLPTGALYATRPDSFGKATYAITTQFNHAPHGILYYRSDDDAILNALYIPSTIITIKQELEDSDPSFLANRWQNLLGFDYDYPTNSYQTDGLFGVFPETTEGYRLPDPDNPNLFGPTETPGSLTPGEMAGKIKDAVLESFVPLTEVPLLYKYINGGVYDPVPKKQVIRDRNGNLLKPSLEPGTIFDIAPMAKKIGTNQIRFVDFTLDGTSNNLYFYSAKELSNTLQMSDFSPILGPIKLVNTNPPIKPAIRQVVPILENNVLGISSQIEISINAYPTVENIKSISLYRSLNQADALSIRSMEMVKEIDLEILDVLNDNIWIISDDFGDLAEIPFGDPLYYRVIVERQIEYPDKNDVNIILNELVPSESSKLMVTTIVENAIPEAPSLAFTANTGVDELTDVVLQWDKTVYKGTYYIYKMNEQGQWSKIYEIFSNDGTVIVPLENTALGVDFLLVADVDNNNQNIYHHFKVVVENTSGLLSDQEQILTIPKILV